MTFPHLIKKTGNPTSEWLPAPARASTFEQPNLFRAAQKIPCYVFENIKIRLRTDYLLPLFTVSGATICILSFGDKIKVFAH